MLSNKCWNDKAVKQIKKCQTKKLVGQAFNLKDYVGVFLS